ncbi:M28 family peptidase [Acetobacter musti]
MTDTIASDSTDVPEAPHAAVDMDVMMAHMTEFARRTKMSGSPDEYASFLYLEKTLTGYGYDTTLFRHAAYISEPGEAQIEIDGVFPTCITHSFSQSTPATGISGEVIWAGRGDPADFADRNVAGKIVLMDGIANPGASLRAGQAGAIGQIQISPHEHLHDMCISPVWGSPTDIEQGNLPKTAVVSVLNHVGVSLKQRLAKGETVTATLHTRVITEWRKIPLLVAELTSPRDNDDSFVLLSGHHDAWYFGVMDNGSANATMLEAARVLAERRAEWQRGLRLCFWSGHSHGRYAGSAWYADHYWEELAGRCAAHVNVDSTGGKGATVLADAPVSAELAALAMRAVKREAGQDLTGRRMLRAGDQSFWGIGIPSMFMSLSEQPAVPGSGKDDRQGGGLGWWWHTPEDLIDKIDPEFLLRDTKVYVDVLWQLLASAILPLDYQSATAALLSELEALQNHLDGRFSLTSLVARARQLHAQCVGLRYTLAETMEERKIPAINTALIAVSRAFVPVDYTTGDRFGHDPALPQHAWPVLDPLRKLVDVPAETDESLFLEVAAQRSVNRMMFALQQAIAALQPVAAQDSVGEALQTQTGE